MERQGGVRGGRTAEGEIGMLGEEEVRSLGVEVRPDVQVSTAHIERYLIETDGT